MGGEYHTLTAWSGYFPASGENEISRTAHTITVKTYMISQTDPNPPNPKFHNFPSNIHTRFSRPILVALFKMPHFSKYLKNLGLGKQCYNWGLGRILYF